MAITKNIIDLMNGEIHVESTLGEGSVFTVTLPLQQQDARQDEIPREWIGIRSLVVDDDRESCQNAAELLESMGLRASFVTDGRAAVKCVAEAKDSPDPIELVLLDWKMPEMDGVEAARRIREEVGPDIPVIILTAYDWTEIESEARAAGVTAFLSKPFYSSKICYLLKEINGDTESFVQNSSADIPGYAGKRILLVEDNDLNREISRTLVNEMGIGTEEAVDGEQAVQKVKESPEGYYDLILMDIQMPKMNGYDAAKAIRAMDRKDVRNLPIIAMTADAFEEDVRAAKRAGMDRHFAKPIDVKAFEQLLHEYLLGNP